MPLHIERAQLNKLPATIQIDLDSLEAIQECYGWDDFPENERNSFFEEGTKNFLDLLEQYKIQATFFVTGKDALDSSKKIIITEIFKKGYEIANHSFSHTIGLSRLNDIELLNEIKSSEDAITNITGIKPKGFRSPGYDVTSRILKILEDSGYEYDSSLLPSFYGILFRLADRFMAGRRLKDKKQFGRFRDGLSPLRPFRPDKEKYWCSGNKSKIIEVPITTFPIIRFPFHSTIIFKFGTSFFDTGYNLLKTYKIPINYVFHIIDLVDIRKIKGLEKLFFLKIPFETRKKIVQYIIEKIKKDYDILKTIDHIKIIPPQNLL